MDRSGKLKSTNDPLILEFITDENYQIYSNGIILSRYSAQGHLTSTWREAGFTQKGYRRIKYKTVNIGIHRIIWAKFGQIPLSNDLVINHKDGNKTNNHIYNLELVPVAANNLHRFRVLKHPPVLGNAKINFQLAHCIRADRALGMKYKDIMRKYGLSSKGTISAIIHHRTWKEKTAA